MNIGLKDIHLALSLRLSVKDRNSVKEQDVKLESTRFNIQERLRAQQTMHSSSSRPSISFKNTESQKRQVAQSRKPIPSSPMITKRSKSNTNSGGDEQDSIAQDILDSILVESPSVSWDDIIGLESTKQALREIVIYPTLRPELFTGLRAPAKGVLLFGPPGILVMHSFYNETKELERQ